jgi:hypothetical protein
MERPLLLRVTDAARGIGYANAMQFAKGGENI